MLGVGDGVGVRLPVGDGVGLTGGVPVVTGVCVSVGEAVAVDVGTGAVRIAQAENSDVLPSGSVAIAVIDCPGVPPGIRRPLPVTHRGSGGAAIEVHLVSAVGPAAQGAGDLF